MPPIPTSLTTSAKYLSSHRLDKKQDDSSLPLHRAEQNQPFVGLMSRLILVVLSLLGACALVVLAAPPAAVGEDTIAASAAKSAPSSASKVSIYADYTAPLAFPTKVFKDYYVKPSGTTQEPRPKVTDPSHTAYFPDSLADPQRLPLLPPASDAVFPVAVHSPTPGFLASIESNITETLNSTLASCDKCVAALKMGQILARTSPKHTPQIMVNLCKKFKYKTDALCESTYAPQVLASTYTQVLSYADLTGSNSTDAQYTCAFLFNNACPLPRPVTYNQKFLREWFRGSTAPSVSRRTEPVGPAKRDARGKKELLRVLHASDIHVDPRYFIGAEAACTNGQCCRSDSWNSTVASGPAAQGTRLNPLNISSQAVYFGAFKCDAPWPLALASLAAVTHINGGKDVDMSLYTGDMVTHDASQHLSRALVKYTQQSIFDAMKFFLGSGPVFSAIGNHDSSPSDAASPHSLPNGRGEQFSWDWNNVARLWEAEGWFTHAEAKQVNQHYGGYSVSPRKGLRIITINTDFWYKGNVFNLINTTNPDVSGSLRFMTDELLKAEKKGERVWIVGHVLTGWDGSNPIDNPTSLFYEIVARFAPHTIAHIFFGHTHEDQFNVFYGKNGTARDTADAVSVSFMGPSVTPGGNVNPSLRIYSVDPETYEVVDYDQWYTQLATFQTLPSTGHGPVFKHLYSAREAYGNFSASAKAGTYRSPVKLTKSHTWPADAPLNASFWAALTDEMVARPDLVQTFTVNQGRNSSRSPACTSSDCVAAKICYMRSGSAVLGKQCLQGFGSVQSGG